MLVEIYFIIVLGGKSEERSDTWCLHRDSQCRSDAEWCASSDDELVATQTRLVRIRRNPISHNNKSRDWWKRFGGFSPAWCNIIWHNLLNHLWGSAAQCRCDTRNDEYTWCPKKSCYRFERQVWNIVNWDAGLLVDSGVWRGNAYV